MSMNKLLILVIVSLIFSIPVAAQEDKEIFTIEKEIEHLPVISQGNTGTCWSFATTSFLESEIIRKGFAETDLSEMYFVYFGYLNKAKKYLMFQGNNNFSQGGQAHDVFDVLRLNGMVAYEAFSGRKSGWKVPARRFGKRFKN
jgi:bleomycin hydrolase